MAKNIILDTDPGIDDAVAFITLHRYRPQDVCMILSSYGNISIEKTTSNALTMCELLSWDVPVVKGCALPQNDRYVPAEHIHGKDGLGGKAMQKHSRTAITGDWQQIVYEKILACGSVDYITIGPLTNLALLLKRYPDIAEHIDNVVTMGGGIAAGNVTKDAEFNIYCDPVSAEYVFKNIKSLALIPLDITNDVWFSEQDIESIRSRGGKTALLMADILTENLHACLKYGENGSVMHDSTAICYYLFPEYFKTERCGISVDTKEHFGKTIKANGSNILLATECDRQSLLDIIAGSITVDNP